MRHWLFTRTLYLPAKSPRRASSRLPGGERRSINSWAAFNMSSLRAAARTTRESSERVRRLALPWNRSSAGLALRRALQKTPPGRAACPGGRQEGRTASMLLGFYVSAWSLRFLEITRQPLTRPQSSEHTPRDTRTRGHEDTWTRGHEDTRTRGHEDTRTRGHEDSRTRGLADTRTRGLEDTRSFCLPGAPSAPSGHLPL